ncbi:hypothetical protein NW767_015523 [Fusarium falciforme]|nr:hypothetical protein NW767_015523 [Fusarium falciforme]
MLLRLYSAETKGCQWTAKDIYFLFDSFEGTAYEAYNPYLAYSLLRTTRYGNTTPTSSRKFPILVEFAQLLLEIASGRNLGPFERRPERPDISLLEELERDSVVQSILAGYVHAVRKCLKANRDNDEGAESEEMQCKAVIRDAVADLEEAWSTGYATKGDPNFPFKFRVPKDILGRRKPNMLNEAARKTPKLISAVVQFPSGQKLTDSSALHGAVPTGTPTQLFDGRKLKLFSNSSDRQ